MAVDDNLGKVLADSKFKHCFEAIKLLAKAKLHQGKIFESLALFKRLLEINPSDYGACFDIA
jgi:hypothetical protein